MGPRSIHDFKFGRDSYLNRRMVSDFRLHISLLVFEEYFNLRSHAFFMIDPVV